ncbi:NmrA family NAD(P)-binding protein [Actinoplanes sp. NBRC 103695]|uniref:NmrA family NAD(P)-binding protein n=1 Tax=Actinoplanes sp. NBRC 103695 TaxID=3032202 RepID=UPI0024A1BB5B|nr:NmrA family NAD(P)-binding protein [Actinoplanes sp. NBRC 103695]GLY98879.1 hypothetical protein Acsp02_61330 [Actinoplanes sp. NBRC 103695]
MAALHAEIERLIAATGLESTIIRPGMFASNALSWWAASIRGDGVVRWPHGAAETAPVDDRDVTEVVARTLYEDGHVGGDYVLTGPESLSQAEQVSIIGDMVGRPIAFEELPPDDEGSRRPTEDGADQEQVGRCLAVDVGDDGLDLRRELGDVGDLRGAVDCSDGGLLPAVG